MAVVTVHSDFGAQENKIGHCFHFFPICLPWSNGNRCHDLRFWMLDYKPVFSLSSFTFIKRLFSSSSLLPLGWCHLHIGEGNGTPLQYSCLKNPMDRGAGGCGPWGCYESGTTKRLHFHALEKEMATHSSVLAWRIPGMGEAGGLPFMGSHRVGHKWSDLAAAAAAAAAASAYLRLLIFSRQSWFQLVLHPAQHFALCTLHISEYNLRLPCLIWKL